MHKFNPQIGISLDLRIELCMDYKCRPHFLVG